MKDYGTLRDAIDNIDSMSYITYIYINDKHRYYCTEIKENKKLVNETNGYYFYCDTDDWFNKKKDELRNKKLNSL